MFRSLLFAGALIALAATPATPQGIPQGHDDIGPVQMCAPIDPSFDAPATEPGDPVDYVS